MIFKHNMQSIYDPRKINWNKLPKQFIISWLINAKTAIIRHPYLITSGLQHNLKLYFARKGSQACIQKNSKWPEGLWSTVLCFAFAS